MANVGSWGARRRSSWQRGAPLSSRGWLPVPGEGGPMYVQEVREVVGVVAPEVGKEFRVFVESQKLADDLDGDDFGVAERGGGSAPSEAPEVGNAVVYEAEDGYDEGAKIHKRRPPLRLYGAIGQHRA